MSIFEDSPIARLSEEIPVIRERYKIPKDFDKTIIVESKAQIMGFGKTHCNDKEMTFLHTSKDFDEDDKEKPISYFYDGAGFKIFSEYVMGCFYGYAFIFIKNIEAFNNDFYLKRELFYEKGIYNVMYTSYGFALIKINVKEIVRPFINDSIEEKITNNIEDFFKNKEFYIKNNFPYKRGILMYGPPGNGKTMLIKYLLTKFTDKYGIIVDCSKGLTVELVEFLDMVLNGEPRVLILEDIDGVESYHRSVLLNVLDGIESMTNSLIIATTNFPEKLDIGLVNRPSRFDEFFSIDLPNDETRKKLITLFFKDLGEDRLKNCVELTKGFCGAYFKELFIVCGVKKIEIEKGVEVVKSQLKFKESFCAKEEEEKMFG